MLGVGNRSFPRSSLNSYSPTLADQCERFALTTVFIQWEQHKEVRCLIRHISQTHCASIFQSLYVFDRPKNAEVNRTSDRSSKKSCNAVFERLYPKNQFLSWQITNVYELCYLQAYLYDAISPPLYSVVSSPSHYLQLGQQTHTYFVVVLIGAWIYMNETLTITITWVRQ